MSYATIIDLKKFGTDAMVRRLSAREAAREFRTGACNPLDRQVYNRDMSSLAACGGPTCRDVLCGAKAVGVAIGGSSTLNFNPPVRMRVDAILVVTSGAAGFDLSDFVINNANQWARGQLFHSAIFAPGADANTSFAGDYIDPGSQVSLVAANLDGAAAQTIWVTLKGPGA